MSIQTEINRIRQSKADIISALETKGINVPDDASLDDLSALVEAIEVGSDPVLQSKTVSPTTSKQTITPDTGYDGLSQVTVNAMTTATQATPSISVSSSGLITASATQTAGYVSAGTKSATKQLTTKGATTWTPKTTNQTIASGTYLTGIQTIKGDSNLVASNIKSGVSIFGVTGSMSASEDLSSELSTQNTLITTQETTIDSIISALEGKASGGSGGSVETGTLNINLDTSNVENFKASIEVVYTDKNVTPQMEKFSSSSSIECVLNTPIVIRVKKTNSDLDTDISSTAEVSGFDTFGELYGELSFGNDTVEVVKYIKATGGSITITQYN